MNHAVIQARAIAKAKAGAKLETEFVATGERSFAGWVFAPTDPARRFTVEILIDGHPLQALVADDFVAELGDRGRGDGCYGFRFGLPEPMARPGAVLEARLANIGTPVGEPIVVGRPEAHPAQRAVGVVDWKGGVRFGGWMGEGQVRADVLVDGELITRARVSGWTQLPGTADAAGVVRTFDIHLPERFADGRPHSLTVRSAARETFTGSPVPFLAFADGLVRLAEAEGAKAEALRAELFDRFVPMSLPMARYHEWRERWQRPPAMRQPCEAAMLLVGEDGMDETLASLEAQAGANWVAASLPPTDEPTGFDPAAARRFLAGDAARAEFLVFGLSGTVLVGDALQRFAEVFERFPDAEAAYADVEIAAVDGAPWPLFFPAFDYERMLEQGYTALLFALRRRGAERALRAGARNLYRLFNAVCDESGSRAAVAHSPGAIARLPALDPAALGRPLAAASAAHLQARGVSCKALPQAARLLPAVRIARPPEIADVAVVVAVRNRGEAMRRLLHSVVPAIRASRAELIVVDNDSADSDTLACLGEIDGRIAKVIRADGAFNAARLRNLGAAATRCAAICFIDVDVEARDDGWIAEMLGRLADPDVGAVGPLLESAHGLVDSAGIVLGPGFSTADAFADRYRDDTGFADTLAVAHETSAVSGAAMLVRADDHRAVGGFDEVRFRSRFGDVDFCLKLAAIGRRIVMTPHARLTRHGGGLPPNLPDGHDRQTRDLRDLRAKWGAVLADDPAYNPLLSLDPLPFTALAWPPRGTEPRFRRSPVAVALPPGF